MSTGSSTPETPESPASSTSNRTPAAGPSPERPGRFSRGARIAVPFVVSGLLLAYLFSRIDAGEALDFVTSRVVLALVVPFVLFNAATLSIEAHCLRRVARSRELELTRLVAARIKAACYLLSILNYGLGAAGLSVLLRRRTASSLADAVGMVFLISLFDIGSVLLLVAVGAGFQEVDAVGVRVGLIAILIGAIVAGFLFLRVPVSLGPLETLRNLEIFRAPRTAPIPLLIELAILRFAFLLCFVGLTAALMSAFGIEVEPFRLGMNVAILIVVSAIPIAAGGLGTGQIVFVELFSGLAPDSKLLAASITLSAGLVVTRALLGFFFAREFTREALEATRSEEDA